jgi:hypothetical protein
MKKIFLLLILIIILLSCNTFSNNNIKRYMESTYNNYPININFSLDNTFCRNNYIDDYNLTHEQKIILEKFIEIFNSNNENINELKKQSKTDTYSINNIFIEYVDFMKEYYIVLAITFYSDHKIWEMWQYDEKNNFWWVFNCAVYSINENDIEIVGWYF